MKKNLLLLIFALFLGYVGIAQSLLVDDFTGLTVGANLAGQSGWTKGGGGPDATIGNTTPLTYSNYNGGGAEYVVMPTATSTTSRVFKLFTPVTSYNETTFYLSFLLRVNTCGLTPNGYFISLGDAAGSTSRLAPKLYVKASGTGFVMGLAKSSTTTGVVFGTNVHNLDETCLIVVKYVFHAPGTTAPASYDDEAYLWINPTISSEPLTSNAECSIPGGPTPIDTDFDGYGVITGGVGSFIWHNRTVANPTGAFDAIRVGHGVTSAEAWTSLNAYSGGTTPYISTSPSTLSGFTYIHGSGPSAEQSFNISGTNLTGDVTIAPPVNYEISTSTGGGFIPTNPITLVPASGTLSSTPIYVRLKAGLSVNTYSGELITATSAGAANSNVTCNGSVTPMLIPAITVAPTSLTGFLALYGNPSPSQTYTVSGENLISAVTVTAPGTYEVSTDNATFSSSLILPQTGGIITGQPVTVYTRIKASAPYGTANGDISHTSSSATTVNVNVTGAVIYPEPTNHALSFTSTAPTYNSIINTWLDNDGTQAATGFLILANTTGIFIDPSDGVPVANDANLGDGSGAMNINHGVQTYTWNGVTSSTHYYFIIYAYTNSLTNINYKVVPAAPTTNVTTPVFTPPVAAWTFDSTWAAPLTPSSVAANFGDQSSTAMIFADSTHGSSKWITAVTGNELTMFQGSIVNDPRETAFLGGAYTEQGGSGNSANGKCMVIKFSMSALQDPILTFATRGSSTGFTAHQWAWSTDGILFTNFGTNTVNNTSTWLTKTLDMSSINALDAAPVVYLRITFTGATGAAGNNRLDNIVIRASAASNLPPTVHTTIATNVGANTATINGTVNANNQTSGVIFVYGLTTSYGDTVIANPPSVTGGITTPVSADLTGLDAAATYHYKVIGANASGYSSGNDATFTTTCLLPGDPGEIYGPANVCANLRVYQYSTTPIANVTYYFWTTPPGCTILTGEGTYTITVNFAPGNDPGTFHVYGTNACGDESQETQLFVSVVQPLTVEVSIVASANPVASGIPVTFTATPVNGGSTPTYQWRVNSNNVGSAGTSYTYVPQNNDEVYCVLTSSETCTYDSVVASNAIIMQVTGTPTNRWVTGTISPVMAICFDAISTITVAGSDSIFVVQSGGSAIMVAGQKILYLPGTTVHSGGYMHGFIDAANPHCGSVKSLDTPASKEESGFTMMDNAFKIYPNPTSGTFTIENLSETTSGNVHVDVLGTLGGKILSADYSDMRKQELSIKGNPAGIYFVKVAAGEKVQTVKIILTK